MDKQLPSVISVGELWLFMIGIVASVALLLILMIPFFSRIYIPTRLRVKRYALTPQAISILKARFKRDGYELIDEIYLESAIPHLLKLRSDSSTYLLALNQCEGEEHWFIEISSDSIDLAQNEPLSILSSAGPGWFVLRLERHLKALSPQIDLQWSRVQNEDPKPRPLGPMARYAVTIAPWR